MFESFKSSRFSLPMNLQLFAEGEGGGGGEPASSNPQPAAAEPFQGTPGWGLPQGANQAAGSPQAVNPLFTEPVPAATEPVAPVPVAATPAVPAGETIEISGRKIVVSDPALAEALKAVQGDYTNLQSKLTKDTTRLKELETTNQTLAQSLQAFQSAQPPAQPAAPAAPANPFGQMTPEEFTEKFYENPLETMQSMMQALVQNTVNPVLQPITQERQMQQQIQSLVQQFPDDAESMLEPMQQVLAENPDMARQIRDGKMSLETAYYIAKGKNAQPQAPAPTAEQLMSDPTFINQIIANPEIQRQILSQHVQTIQQGNAQIPVVMGNQPGGQAPSAPAAKPTTMREGSKAWLASNW